MDSSSPSPAPSLQADVGHTDIVLQDVLQLDTEKDAMTWPSMNMLDAEGV